MKRGGAGLLGNATRQPNKGRSRSVRYSTLIVLGLSALMLVYMFMVVRYAVGQQSPEAADETTTPSTPRQTESELERLQHQLLLEQQDAHQKRLLQEAREHAQEVAQTRDSRRTLRFQVCNGFGNQRLAVMYAAILAKGTHRALVLPQLIREGTQRSSADNSGGGTGSMADFGMVYDVETFKRESAALGMHVLTDAEAPPLSEYTSVRLRPFQTNAAELLEREHGQDTHIAIDCALFKLFPLDYSVETFAWGVLEAMQPSQPILSVINAAAKALHRGGVLSPDGQPVKWGFNVLHLRVEDDWLAHCRRWENLNDGQVRNNCLTNTDTVGDFMQLVGVKPDLPLYVAAHWPDVDPARNASIMAHLEQSGYQVITSNAILPGILAELARTYKGEAVDLSRDVMACVDYSLALLGHKFIGNSVSTFSALILLERRHHDRWSISYNEGNIPLTFPLPVLHKMPWVFTYNSWSPLYDDMMKVAVKSGITHGRLKGYCLFLGDPKSLIYRWLVNQGIVMIPHEPVWRDALVRAAQSFMHKNMAYSHLFKNADMLVSTFQRVDLPLVEEISQYNYVLFTDADVFFRRSITLDDFGLPLPDALSMAYELRPGMYPLNAGVMLMHLPRLRQTHEDFLKFILDNKTGMQFGEHGPVDQGAYNQFYQPVNNTRELHQRFNAKVYNTYMRDGAIVHFHGPKPREFLKYVEDGDCKGFFWLCEYGWLGSLCTYWQDWDAVFADVYKEDAANKMLTETSDKTARMSSRILDACKWIEKRKTSRYWTGTETPHDALIRVHNTKWITGEYASRFVDVDTMPRAR